MGDNQRNIILIPDAHVGCRHYQCVEGEFATAGSCLTLGYGIYNFTGEISGELTLPDVKFRIRGLEAFKLDVGSRIELELLIGQSFALNYVVGYL